MTFSPTILSLLQKSYQQREPLLDNKLNALCLWRFMRVNNDLQLRKKSLEKVWGIVGKCVSLQQKKSRKV